MHPSTQAVAGALATTGASGQVREMSASTRTAAEAAAALDCPLGAIANSLVFLADDEPLLVLTSGAHRVDPAHLAAQIGAQRVRRASPEQVREATGQTVGGVAPVGHARPVRTLVDTALAAFPVLWAAAGTPHSVFPTSYEELVRICGGQPVSVAPDAD